MCLLLNAYGDALARGPIYWKLEWYAEFGGNYAFFVVTNWNFVLTGYGVWTSTLKHLFPPWFDNFFLSADSCKLRASCRDLFSLSVRSLFSFSDVPWFSNVSKLSKQSRISRKTKVFTKFLYFPKFLKFSKFSKIFRNF